MNKPYDAIGMGEIMLRLSPCGSERLTQSKTLAAHAGGSEFNVMAGISELGLKTAMITKLPSSGLRGLIAGQMSASGVDSRYVIGDDSEDARLGIYYYENGASPRKPSVVYDRKNSSFTHLNFSELPDDVYSGARLFHTSGITLALSEELCAGASTFMKKSKDNGALVSFDVNYRANLWSEEKARFSIESILPCVDILFISEESCRRMFGRTGELGDIMKDFAAEYSLKIIATTKRTVNSPLNHDFTSVLYDAENDAFHTGKPYRGIQVVDRIGSGDAYVSGVLYAVLSGLSMDKAVEYGNAMASVKETVPGDIISTDLNEINGIIAAHHGGAQSEMNR